MKPCKENQVRNPLTNRCKKKTPEVGPVGPGPKESGPKPCRPDQFRNPLTGRCKKKKTERVPPQIPVPVPGNPCRPGQILNPLTGRCRKECRPDQIRNPRTGRCIVNPRPAVQVNNNYPLPRPRPVEEPFFLTAKTRFLTHNKNKVSYNWDISPDQLWSIDVNGNIGTHGPGDFVLYDNNGIVGLTSSSTGTFKLIHNGNGEYHVGDNNGYI